MNTIILAALLTCTTGEARCTSFETQTVIVINICDVEPESAGAEPAEFKARFGDTLYQVKISPACEST
jgi:hypothetical protein